MSLGANITICLIKCYTLARLSENFYFRRKIHRFSEVAIKSHDSVHRKDNRVCNRQSLKYSYDHVVRVASMKPTSDDRFAVVAIGASAGGPNALEILMSKFRRGLPVAIVLSQHIPGGFTRSLAQRLADVSGLTVREAYNGCTLSVGEMLVAPGGCNMEIRKGGLIRVEKAPQIGPSPSIDVMMKSAAKVYGSRCIGVLLTGMLNDGTEGMRAIKGCGGITIVQDETSSVVYGMPKAVIDAGAADIVADISDIPSQIVTAVGIVLSRWDSWVK
jgi:two-component system chemotaxis response regulator CheB